MTPGFLSTTSCDDDKAGLRANCIAALLSLLSLQAFAQPLQLDMDVFAQRRTQLMRQLETRSVAIFPCKPEYTRNGDVDYDYRQESSFYYLTGFEEPQSILLLNPSAPHYKYVLFVRGRNSILETYEGQRAGITGAMATFKVDTSLLFSDFLRSVTSFAPDGGILYYTFGINAKIDEEVRQVFLESSGTSWSVQDPSPKLAEMRLLKNEGDWTMGFRRAIEISTRAHIDAIKGIRPGMYEYEVQALFEYTYRRNGSPRNGYPCIIASGPNSCTMHYEKNSRRMEDGDLVLMDCGAEYGYYSADITRTVPVNGKFTPTQRQIYQLVLDAQNAGMNIVKPGLPWNAVDSTMRDVLAAGLLKFGFIKEKKDVSLYALHGFSHWLGLDVHDIGKTTIGSRSRPLKAGMVFTLEPGLYIRPDIFDRMKDVGYTQDEIARLRTRLEPYMNIGVRIEDDVVVTEDGHRDLTRVVPRDAGTIEALMGH